MIYRNNITNRKIPKGLIDKGESITLPLSIFDLMLEGGHLLDVPTIPLYEIARPLDNRICCPYARCNDAEAAATCEWATDPERTGCKLGDGRPCLFDEPDDSEMWQWVREQRAIQEEIARQREEGSR